MAKANLKDVVLFVDHVAVANLKSLHVDVDDEHHLVQYEQYGVDENESITILKLKPDEEKEEEKDEQ